MLPTKVMEITRMMQYHMTSNVQGSLCMMTSSNGNIFRVTGHLCGKFTGHRWISHTKASEGGALMFTLICARKNGWVNNGEAGDLRRYLAHYDVIVMVLSVEIEPHRSILLAYDTLCIRLIKPSKKYRSYFTVSVSANRRYICKTLISAITYSDKV